MDPVKEAFKKIKNDMQYLKENIDHLKKCFEYTKQHLGEIRNQQEVFHNKFNTNREILNNQQNTLQQIVKIQEKQQEILENIQNSSKTGFSTHNQQNQTPSTHPSTHNLPFKPLNTQNIGISTGNQGVSTDRQTDTQTDRQTQNIHQIQENSVDNALEILKSLDNIKKEIRLKFKRLTDQEWIIFSTLYQLDEQQGCSNYKSLADRLKLTESSIRDYIGRLIKKGIPIEKNRINNKTIQLSVSSNLKKIASLSTIIQLRGL